MYQVHRRGSEQSLYAGEPQVNKHLAKPVVLCTSPARLFMPSTLNVLAFIKQHCRKTFSLLCVEGFLLRVVYCSRAYVRSTFLADVLRLAPCLSAALCYRVGLSLAERVPCKQFLYGTRQH